MLPPAAGFAQGLVQFSCFDLGGVEGQRSPHGARGGIQIARLEEREGQLEMSGRESRVSGQRLFEVRAGLRGLIVAQVVRAEVEPWERGGGIARDRAFIGRDRAGGVTGLLEGVAQIHFGHDLARVPLQGLPVRGHGAGHVALRRPGESRDFILSVLPSLIAWVALALPRPADLLMLMVLFTAMGIVDTVSQNDTLIPEWYRRLRMILTLGVVGSLTIAVVLSP